MQSMSSSSSTLLLSPSPSLSCYSAGKNNTLAEIAARVAHEVSLQEHHQLVEGDDAEDFFFHTSEPEFPQRPQSDERGCQKAADFDDGDEEFEFAVVGGGPESYPVSADEIFYNGQIRPMYKYSSPVHFYRAPHSEEGHGKQGRRPRRRPLKLLMSEDDPRAADEPPEPGFSCSSSESDELEGAAPGTYCVWAPREAPGQKCRKSSSTGSGAGSRRWKLKLLLLNRSNSDGRTGTLSVLQPTKAGGGNAADGEGAKGRRSTEGHGGKRSYLPYRSDVVGFFANVNGLSRNLHPFP